MFLWIYFPNYIQSILIVSIIFIQLISCHFFWWLYSTFDFLTFSFVEDAFVLKFQASHFKFCFAQVLMFHLFLVQLWSLLLKLLHQSNISALTVRFVLYSDLLWTILLIQFSVLVLITNFIELICSNCCVLIVLCIYLTSSCEQLLTVFM